MTNRSAPVELIQRQDARTMEAKGRIAVQKLTNRLERLVIEEVPIDSIYPNPYNPNRQSEHEFEMLMRSIVEDGFTQPVIVQSGSKMIVDGEHRWRAMNRLGMRSIPVVFVDMTDQQMRISTLRHNRARGSEDIELSIDVLKDLRELGALEAAMDSLDIADTELQALLNDLPAPEIMANANFSEGWTPDKTADAVEPERLLKDRRVSTSTEAQQHLERMREKKEDVTSHLAERDLNYESSKNITQVTATFSDTDEKALVRQVLGLKPAQRLVELCVKKVLANQDQYEQWLYDMAVGVNDRWTK